MVTFTRADAAPSRTQPVEIDLRGATVDLVSLAYQQILNEILSGTIPPGAPLRVDKLARRYNISHTPVKQAIAQLVGRGLLEHLPNRGMRVRVLDDAEFRDVVGARLMCEVHAVREAVAAAPEGAAEALSQIRENIRAHEALAFRVRDDVQRWHAALVDADAELHASIVALAKNERISSWHAHLNLLLYGWHAVVRRDLRRIPRGELERSVREHWDIAGAIEARDAARAEALLRAHIATQLDPERLRAAP